MFNDLHGGSCELEFTSRSGIFVEFQIPLPPLEVQKEIVAEIEGYQKVINGARAVLDHYRPHIPIHPDWPMVELGEVCEAISDGDRSAPPCTRPITYDGGIPFISPKMSFVNVQLDVAKMHSPSLAKTSSQRVDLDRKNDDDCRHDCREHW